MRNFAENVANIGIHITNAFIVCMQNEADCYFRYEVYSYYKILQEELRAGENTQS